MPFVIFQKFKEYCLKAENSTDFELIKLKHINLNVWFDVVKSKGRCYHYKKLLFEEEAVIVAESVYEYFKEADFQNQAMFEFTSNEKIEQLKSQAADGIEVSVVVMCMDMEDYDDIFNFLTRGLRDKQKIKVKSIIGEKELLKLLTRGLFK